jgi:phenylalanyl-tRNA synthetase beta chain
VAIGTHDLAKCRGPFTYEAQPPSEISFVPLKQTRKFRADELMEVRGGWVGENGVLQL